MTRYNIDSKSATIAFNATSSLHPIVARAPVSGWIEADIAGDQFAPESTLAGEVEIAVDAIASGNPIYDAETRRRIDVNAHPLIRAELTAAPSVDGATAAVEGNVHFHGESVLLEGALELAPGPLLTGEGTVDIRWWDLKPPSLLVFRVQPEVLITVDLPLVADG